MVTEWVTGSGYLIKVFEFSAEKGEPQLILDTGGKGLPDLILSPTRDFDFAMLMRADEDGVAARGGANDRATIYKFKHGTKIIKSSANWARRFDGIAR